MAVGDVMRTTLCWFPVGPDSDVRPCLMPQTHVVIHRVDGRQWKKNVCEFHATVYVIAEMERPSGMYEVVKKRGPKPTVHVDWRAREATEASE